MRILLLSQYFWPENFRINDLAEGLLARGHKVTVLTGLPNYPSGNFATGYRWTGPYRESHKGIEVLRVPIIPRGNGNNLALALNYLSFAFFATLLGPLICSGEYDAMLVYEPSPMTVGIPARFIRWVKKLPVFFWVQDLWPESLSATGAISEPKVLNAVEYMVRWIYRGCDRVLVQSEAFVGSVGRLGVEATRIKYFPNSAEAFYKPLPPSLPWDGPQLPKGFRVMYAGNIGSAQSFETILEAAERLRQYEQIQWIIVGDGRCLGWLSLEVARRCLNGCVHLLGRHPVESMPKWFAQADVMLASLRRDPIFSLTIPAKIQSYMACAKRLSTAVPKPEKIARE